MFSVTQEHSIKKARITRELKDWASELGVSIHRAKVGDCRKIAIHLLEPEQFELERALADAEAKGFTAIYLHTFKTWLTHKPRSPIRLDVIQGGRSVFL